MSSPLLRVAPYLVSALLLSTVLVMVFGKKNLPPPSQRGTRPIPSLGPIQNPAIAYDTLPEKIAPRRVKIPNGTILVTVQDKYGSALVGSTISSADDPGVALATADNRGEIELPDATLSEVEEAIVAHPGFIPESMTSLSLMESRQIVVTLGKGADLDLVVLDQDYKPLEGIACLVASTVVTRADTRKLTLSMTRRRKRTAALLRDGHIIQIALTNSSGRADITGMRPGEYHLQVYHSEFIVTDINAGPTLPTVAQIVMERPAVILAELQPMDDVVWWRVKMPRELIAHGYAQRAASQLQSYLRTVHPNAVCSVGIGVSVADLPRAEIRALFGGYGWQTIPLPFRPYTEGMQPLEVRPELTTTSPMGRVRITIASPSKRNPLSDQTSRMLFRVAPLNSKGTADIIRSIPIKPGGDTPLPYGKYRIVSISSIISAGTAKECEFTIDSKSLLKVDLQLSREITTVRFSIFDEEGRHLERGLIAIEADGRRTSKLFNDGMSNAAFWCPYGERRIRVEAEGYLPVEQTIFVDGDGPFVVPVECRKRR